MDLDVGETGFYDALGCLVLQVDAQACIRFANRFALGLIDADSIDSVVGKPLKALLPSDDSRSGELLAHLRTVGQHAPRSPIESGLLRRDGTSLPIVWHLNSRHHDGTSGTTLVGFDLTSIHGNRAAADLFRIVSDQFEGSILITDADNTILYANPALTRMTGFPAEEVIGETPRLFKSGQTAESLYRDLWETLTAGGIWRGEFINRRKDGSTYPESKTISAIRDERGRVRHYFAIGEDLTWRHQFEQRFDALLASDPLTGLPNRNAFLELLSSQLEKAGQIGKDLSVVHVDIDDFYLVNESVGVTAADQLIIEVSSRLKNALRQDDSLARVGNDKFAFLLGPYESGAETDLDDVVARILATVRQPLAGHTLSLTASVGLARFPAHGDDAGELLNHAISATERAKRSGGNTFLRFDPSSSPGDNGRRDLLRDLRGAIERHEFVLYYQPQVSLYSGAIVGLEALIRWQHPARGLVMPGDFIPLVEESQLVVDVGEWVLREACRQLRAWLDEDLPAVKLAINLSARHFVVPGLPAMIADALAAQRIEARYLELEITEGAMMRDVAGAVRSMAQLKEIGVRISLDDFGTGYSSLAYLSRFPIDVVKIDQSFVRDITDNPVNAAIAQATIAMSHKLGKTVLAEGVETEAQMAYLRRNQCDEMQGYFFSRPVPASEITRMLSAGTTMPIARHSHNEAQHTVLFVDDEPSILASIRRALRREGYTVLTAETTSEAFSLLATTTVHVVVTDQRMSCMSGTEFLSRVKNLYPETVRMVLSGYSEISAVTDAINKGAVYRFLSKPWDDETLKSEVFSALRHWQTLYGHEDEDDGTELVDN